MWPGSTVTRSDPTTASGSQVAPPLVTEVVTRLPVAVGRERASWVDSARMSVRAVGSGRQGPPAAIQPARIRVTALPLRPDVLKAPPWALPGRPRAGVNSRGLASASQREPCWSIARSATPGAQPAGPARRQRVERPPSASAYSARAASRQPSAMPASRRCPTAAQASGRRPPRRVRQGPRGRPDQAWFKIAGPSLGRDSRATTGHQGLVPVSYTA